jgi:hypothetical protein
MKVTYIAKQAKAFLPILSHLEELHAKGFVHGDIRAFNTVFGEQDNEGWLIDFDFGGAFGSTCYPKGYRRQLDDGYRMGNGVNEILQWHDWYALGQLIFRVHIFKEPGGDNKSNTNLVRKSRVEAFWMDGDDVERCWAENDSDLATKHIKELKVLLHDLDEEEWTVKPNGFFKEVLESTSRTGLAATHRGY